MWLLVYPLLDCYPLYPMTPAEQSHRPSSRDTERLLCVLRRLKRLASRWEKDVKVATTLWRCFKMDRHINVGTGNPAPLNIAEFVWQTTAPVQPFELFLDVTAHVLGDEASAKAASNLLSRIAVNLPSKPRVVRDQADREGAVGSGLCSTLDGLSNLGALLRTILRCVLSRPASGEQARMYLHGAGLEEATEPEAALRQRLLASVTDYLLNKRADFALSSGKARRVILQDSFCLLAMLQVSRAANACRSVVGLWRSQRLCPCVEPPARRVVGSLVHRRLASPPATLTPMRCRASPACPRLAAGCSLPP